MGIPKHKNDERQVFDLLCRHLVALCVTYDVHDAAQSESTLIFKAYAGTLIRIGNTVSFLTAGHIVRELENAFHSNELIFKTAVLADTFVSKRVSKYPIPFALKIAPRFFIDDDEDGLDFGLIRLEPYYLRLLAANGMVALEEKNWIHQHKIDFDGYLMLGLPTEFSSSHLRESGDAFVAPTYIGVERLDPPPAIVRKTHFRRFVGRIDKIEPLKSIDGMSGGPIFGFKFGPPMRYWIVALQSSWLRDQRIVLGCPISLFGQLLTEWASEVETRSTD